MVCANLRWKMKPLTLTSTALAIAIGAWVGVKLHSAPFSPPGEKKRADAVGQTKGLPEDLARAFDPASPAFDAIAKPAPADWLANHKEPGQTFLQFIKARRNQPDANRNVLYIYPLGEFSEKLKSPPLEALREYSEAYFGMPTKLLPQQKDLAGLGIKTRINPGTGKRQLLSADILELMPKKLPKDAFCMLAVTMEDLYPEESWNFVFGQASLRERVGVFSFARYDPAFFGEGRNAESAKLVLQRSFKILVHETGHMFGIRHCIHFECIMNGSNHLGESDAKPMHLCPVCLRKLYQSKRFDPVERYRALQKLYTEHELDKQEAWVKKRIGAIGKE